MSEGIAMKGRIRVKVGKDKGLTIMGEVRTGMTIEVEEGLSMKRVVGMTVPVPR